MKYLSFILLISFSFGQWRDSATYIVPTPSGKKVRIAQFSLGTTDTLPAKTEGALAYKNKTLFLGNGTYFDKIGGAGDSADFVTKGTTQVISASKYFTGVQRFKNADTYFGSASGGNGILNIWDDDIAAFATITTDVGSFTFGAYNFSNIGTITSGTVTATGLSTFDSLKTKTIKPISTGSAAIAGDAVLVAGTKTVSTTAIKSTGIVMLTRKTAGGVIGNITYTITAGTSFTINSDNALDTSTMSWFVLTPY